MPRMCGSARSRNCQSVRPGSRPSGRSGELGFYLTSDGTGNPFRVRINAPSFTNLQVMEYIMEGTLLADTVILIGSIDPVMGEADK